MQGEPQRANLDWLILRWIVMHPGISSQALSDVTGLAGWRVWERLRRLERLRMIQRLVPWANIHTASGRARSLWYATRSVHERWRLPWGAPYMADSGDLATHALMAPSADWIASIAAALVALPMVHGVESSRGVQWNTKDVIGDGGLMFDVGPPTAPVALWKPLDIAHAPAPDVQRWICPVLWVSPLMLADQIERTVQRVIIAAHRMSPFPLRVDTLVVTFQSFPETEAVVIAAIRRALRAIPATLLPTTMVTVQPWDGTIASMTALSRSSLTVGLTPEHDQSRSLGMPWGIDWSDLAQYRAAWVQQIAPSSHAA